jgi:hypothetical protein
MEASYGPKQPLPWGNFLAEHNLRDTTQGIRHGPLGYVHRDWADRAWKNWYDWAIRSRLKPIKREMRLSARATRSKRRAARTVADLAEEEKTGPRALAEAQRDRAAEPGSTSSAELPDPAANRFTLALRSQHGVRNLTPGVRELSLNGENAGS